jgi:hypothetical protein
VKADPVTAFPYERECKECGTRYTTIPAAPSSTVRTAAYVSGAVLMLGGVLAWLHSTVAIPALGGRGFASFLFLLDRAFPMDVAIPALGGRGFSSFSMLGLFLSLIAGFTILRTPGRVQELREKLFKEYQASAPLGAPPPVELPRDPDMVVLSVIVGLFSLGFPLVAPLLMGVLFGPAAVVWGVVALSQGHFKGLIGLVLGVVSLIVWGSVFVYFFQG